VRYATGDDRRCSDHTDTGEGVADRLARLTTLTAAPGDGEPIPLNSRDW
jgi:hypothetical protein